MHSFFFFLSRFNVFYHHYAFSYLCALNMQMNMKYFVSVVLLALCLACQNQVYESYTDTVQVNGVNLFYAAEGSGKPIILLIVCCRMRTFRFCRCLHRWIDC